MHRGALHDARVPRPCGSRVCPYDELYFGASASVFLPALASAKSTSTATHSLLFLDLVFRFANSAYTRYLTHSAIFAMKSLASFAVALLAAAPLAASNAILGRDSCELVEGSALCPTCDGQNVTDAVDDKWSISCDWVADSDSEQAVEGVVSFRNCLNACDDAEDCFAVNFASNGSCVIVGGEQQALRSSAGFTNLARLLPEATRTSTTQPPTGSPTSLTGECDLLDDELCPKCNGQVAVDSNNKAYRVLCDTSIDSNGSYSVQEWLSPGECLEQCDVLDFCTGATYYDERSCEIAKADPSAKYDVSSTAFFPIFTASPSTTKGGSSSQSSSSSSKTQPWNTTTTAPLPGPTASTLPIPSGCNSSAVTCPECDGFPVLDKLNGSYTVMCDIEPSCVSKSVHRDPGTQDLCLESCDQSVTCLAAMWFPISKACHLCSQGIVSAVAMENLPYVLLVADNDGDGDTGDATLSLSTSTTGTTARGSTPTVSAVTSETESITDLPRPFSSVPTTSATTVSAGPVSVASVSPVSGSTTPAQPVSSGVPNIANLTCPANDDNVYQNSNGDYFAVACDSRFDAAHSRFLSASDFAACAASCTGSCDGVQFGATTRCGLYTDISVVGPATGWTVAASVMFPTATGLPATITSMDATSSTPAMVPSTTSFATSRTNGTVSWTAPGMTGASVTPSAYEPPAYNPL